jgi:hypothetical protein
VSKGTPQGRAERTVAVSDREHVNKCHDDYLDERRILVQEEFQCSHQFDKYVITLASGALGLSITFMDKIVSQPVDTWMLCISWGAFILCLVFVLWSFISSQTAFQQQRRILDESYLAVSGGKRADADKAEGEAANVKNRAANITRRLMFASAITFVIGVVFLSGFSVANLRVREHETMSKAGVSSRTVRTLRNSPTPPKPPLPRPQPKPASGPSKPATK